MCWSRCRAAVARIGRGLSGAGGAAQQALMLQCEHWLEAADPKHRYGTNLRPYFEYWLEEIQERERNEQQRSHKQQQQQQQILQQQQQLLGQQPGGGDLGEEEAQGRQRQLEERRRQWERSGAVGDEGGRSSPGADRGAGAGVGAAPAGSPRWPAVAAAQPALHPTADDSQLTNLGRPLARRGPAARDSCGAATGAGGEGEEDGGRSPVIRVPVRKCHSAPRLHDMGGIFHDDDPGSKPATPPPVCQPLRAASVCGPGGAGVPPGGAASATSGPAAGAAEAISEAPWEVPRAAPQAPEPASPQHGQQQQQQGHAAGRPRHTHADARFFYWLDEGGGQGLDLLDLGVSRSKLERQRVRYLSESELDKLEVRVDRARGGLLVFRASGLPVDTGSEVQLVQAPETAGGNAGSNGAGSAGGEGGRRVAQPEVPAEREGARGGGGRAPAPPPARRRPGQQRDQLGAPAPAARGQQQPQQQLQRRSVGRRGKHKDRSGGFELDAMELLQKRAAATAAAAAAAAAATEGAAGCSAEHPCPACARSAGAPRAAADSGSPPDGRARAHDQSPAARGAEGAPAAAAAAAATAATAAAPLAAPSHLAAGPGADEPSGRQPAGKVPPAGGAQGPATGEAGLLHFETKPSKWIYVLDTSGRLYVHAKRRGSFHHSSFLRGGAVLSAGGIVAREGRVVKLTADSGHYRPSFYNFMGMVQLLRDWGADLRDTKLSAKHIDCPL